MTMILANFTASRLWSGDLNSLTEVSSLSAVVMNRVLFQEDLAKLELALKSAVAQALLNTGESVSKIHKAGLVVNSQVHAYVYVGELLMFAKL